MIELGTRSDIIHLLKDEEKKGVYKGKDGDYEIKVEYLGWGWIILGVSGPKWGAPIIAKSLSRPISKIITAFRKKKNFG